MSPEWRSKVGEYRAAVQRWIDGRSSSIQDVSAWWKGGPGQPPWAQSWLESRKIVIVGLFIWKPRTRRYSFDIDPYFTVRRSVFSCLRLSIRCIQDGLWRRVAREIASPITVVLGTLHFVHVLWFIVGFQRQVCLCRVTLPTFYTFLHLFVQ